MARPRARRRGTALLVLVLAAAAPEARGAEEWAGELKSVGEVRVEGVRSVRMRELRAVMKTRPGAPWPWAARQSLRLDFVRADTAAIVGVYRHHGFLDARVSFAFEPLREPDRVRVRFRVEEGPRVRIAGVSFGGMAAYSEARLRRRLLARPGRPFDPALLQVDTLTISAAYQEQGHWPHTQASWNRAGDRVQVHYEVLEGARYRFGESYIAGLERASERMARRELVLPQGQYFRLSRVRQSVERLYESGLFDRVQVSPIPDSTHSEILFYVLLHERKRRWLDGGLGTGTSERFRVTGEWGHRNMGRLGLLGALAGRLALDAEGRFLLSRGEASLLSPWIGGWRVPTRLTAYYERKDDRTDPQWVVHQDARGLALQVSRHLNRFTTATLGLDNTFVDQDLDYNAGVVPSQQRQDSLQQFFVEHYQTNRLQLAVDRDFRDHPFNTLSGSRQLASAEVAGGPFRGGSSFEKWVASSSWYTPIGGRGVIALRLRGGVIRPFGDRFFSPPELVDEQVRRVPTEDRLKLGGVNTVRGYDEDQMVPSGGLAMLHGNLELRLPLWGPVGAELFLDGGNVWARPEYLKAEDFVPEVSSDQIQPGQVVYTTGAGLRLNLPVGPLRLDWAWGFRPPARTPKGEAPESIVARLQFAIGPSF